MNHYLIFARRLCLVIVILIPTLYVVHSFESLHNYLDLSIYSSIMFIVHSILLYMYMFKSAKSSDKQLFISLTLANMLVRVVCSIVLLIVYKKLFNPVDGKFIIPFLCVYLIFTIFESGFMVGLAGEKPKKEQT